MSDIIAVLNEILKGLRYRGPSWSVTRKYTVSADMTTAAPITYRPDPNKKIVADDIIVSNGGSSAILFDIEMEDSSEVLTAVRVPADGTYQWTLIDSLKGTATNKKLYGKASAAGNVYVTVLYHSEE